MSQAEIHSIVCGALANGHSLYGLDAQLIEAADPDIILTQALCDVCAVSYPKVLSTCAKVLAGDEARPRVISIEPTTYDEVLNTILHVGEVCGALPQARQLVASLQAAHAHTVSLVAAKLSAGATRPRVAFLEWTEPLFVGGHWVPGQIHAAGGEASYVESGERSRVLPHEELVASAPEVIFVAPCGYEQERAAKDTQALWRHDWWRALPAVTAGRVYALDANSYFARPGPRVVQGAALLAYLLHGVESEATPKGGWIRVHPPADAQGGGAM